MTRTQSLLLIILLVAASMTGAGCAILKPTPRVTYSGSSRYKPQTPTSPSQVQVYRLGDDATSLPEGISVNENANFFDQSILLEENYPTAERPNLLVGQYTARKEGSITDKQAIDAIVAKAASHGATAVVVKLQERSVKGMGIFVSDAQPATVEAKPADELLDDEATHPSQKNYTELMTTEKRALDNFEPLEIDGKRGTCYWVVFALDKDAKLSSHARRGLKFDFAAADRDIDERAGMITIEEKTGTGQLKRSARSGSIPVGCPQKSGTIEADMQASWGSANSKARLHDLGEGEVVYRIYTRSVSEEELAKRKEKSERLRKEARERSKEFNRRICRQCANKLVLCGDTDPSMCSAYTNCIARKSGRLDFCLKGL